MVENATRIKFGIKRIQKNMMDVKKVISGILLHEVVKMIDKQKVLLTIQRLKYFKKNYSNKKFFRKFLFFFKAFY